MKKVMNIFDGLLVLIFMILLIFRACHFIIRYLLHDYFIQAPFLWLSPDDIYFWRLSFSLICIAASPLPAYHAMCTPYSLRFSYLLSHFDIYFRWAVFSIGQSYAILLHTPPPPARSPRLKQVKMLPKVMLL
jgi:hypothetical protein